VAPTLDHIDLVVSDLDRSLDFYRGLLRPLGWTWEGEIVGEQGERVVYLGGEPPNARWR
jgi:catechol 2,3-dioxygenase-like lactoylglutathione lyase family enzyme